MIPTPHPLTHDHNGPYRKFKFGHVAKQWANSGPGEYVSLRLILFRPTSTSHLDLPQTPGPISREYVTFSQ